MNQLPGYEMQEKLAEAHDYHLYRGKSVNSGEPVIIKQIVSPLINPTDMARFKYELNRIKTIRDDGLLRIIDVMEDQQHGYIIYENFDGVKLSTLIQKQSLSLSTILSAGIQLAKTLHSLHQADIAHKAIKPDNILLDMGSQKSKLLGFEIESTPALLYERISDPDVIRQKLVYLSPEQTGRINHHEDPRSDLYSLGITLYELLTGQLPFIHSNPVKILHFHIAQEAPVLTEADGVPQALADIIHKLLRKQPEERYQSARGLQSDLQQCLQQLEQSGHISPFPLAQQDIALKFQAPQILLGRAPQIKQLMDAFDLACSGNCQIMLIEGNAGIGKSALIHQINTPIMEKGGFFLSGKFEQLKKELPYSGITQAYSGVIQSLLSEPDGELVDWRIAIQAALGNNGRVMTEVLPQLELIIGPQPELPALDPEKNRNRFNLTFQKFAELFGQENHPIVLFLDDLHWADLPSIELIATLLESSILHHTILIFSYRQDETPTYVLNMINELLRKQNHIERIELNPLMPDSINEWLQKILKCTPQKSLALAQLVYRKTNGNPFFMNRFMKSLYESRLLTFTLETGWSWDEEKILELQITDNVVDLLTKEILNLPETTRNLLKLCACLGNQIDLLTLAGLSGQMPQQVLELLNIAINRDYLRIHNHLYYFTHDRIQESSYSLIPMHEKAHIHLHIAHYLHNHIPENQFNNHLFSIVDHYNLGIALVDSPEEKILIAGLNKNAGVMALNSAAYASALGYFEQGIMLLPEKKWTQHYALSYKLHFNAARAAYLTRNYPKTDQLINAGLPHITNLLDEVRLSNIRLDMLTAQHHYKDCIALGLASLKKLGLTIPSHPSRLTFLTEIVKSLYKLKSRSEQDLMALPLMQEQNIIEIDRIIPIIFQACYIAAPELAPILPLKIVQLSLQYGIAANTPTSFGGYGFILCSLGLIEKGYVYSKLAIKMLSRINASECQTKTYMAMYAFSGTWKKHLLECSEGLYTTYRLGIESGDLEYASTSLYIHMVYKFAAGVPLPICIQEANLHLQTLASINQPHQYDALKLYYHLFCRLADAPIDPRFQLSNSQLTDLLQHYRTSNNNSVLYVYYSVKTHEAFLNEDYGLARDCCQQSELFVAGVRANYRYAEYHFLDSLTLLNVWTTLSWAKRIQASQHLRRNQKKLKKWSHHCPQNYLNKWLLIEALIAQHQKKYARAQQCFQESIQQSKTQGFLHEQGIACELMAAMYFELNQKENGIYYITLAFQCFTRWGAQIKLRRLLQKYPELADTARSIKSSQFSDAIDLAAVIESTQAIAREYRLEGLLERTIKIMIETSGANSGTLLLEHNGQLFVEITAKDNGLYDISSQAVNPSLNTELPLSVLSFVKRTGQTILLNNIAIENPYRTDPFFTGDRVKSLLCLPITQQSRFLGILLLYNEKNRHVFTPQQLNILNILSVQVAISLENARHTDELEKRVFERTAELIHATEQIQKQQTLLIQQERLAALGDITSSVAHEISTPLMTITMAMNKFSRYVGNLREIVNKNTSLESLLADVRFQHAHENYDYDLDIVHVSLEIIRQQIINMKKFIKFQDNNDESFDLNEALQTTLSILNFKILSNATVNVSLAQNIPALKGNAAQLNQVFMNIIKNAVEAVRADQNQCIIDIGTELTPSWINVSIKDNGNGMDIPTQNKLFKEKFTTKTEGTGLGLAICKDIIDKHGGEIKINSQTGQGTTVTISLPNQKNTDYTEEIIYNKE